MSASETDSEPECATDTVASLSTYARLSTVRPGQGTVSWAVDTLATLDARLVRKDTALHGLIQDCASTILALFNTVLQGGCYSIPDIANILRPSFLHLLFQYRRLFHVIAARGFKPTSAPLPVVCWVDLVLAKLGDVAAFIAAGLDDDPDRSLPQSLKTKREEDNLRAALQLPDNWDMLPHMLLSERGSAAAKRLSLRLILGRYILHPVLSGQAGVDNTIHGLLSTLAEFLRQSAARVDELRFLLGPNLQYLLQQERLTSAMSVSLFAAADMASAAISVNPERAAAFRPQTTAAAMQLLRFVLHSGGCSTHTSVLSPLDHLDVPTSVILRWGIVPQWTWSIWLEYRSLHADTIISLTTAYIQHQRISGSLLEVADSMLSGGNQAAAINVTVDLIFRFISALSRNEYSKQLSAGMVGVLHGSCQLISRWIYRNSCGIQNSMQCCKALIILFGYLSQDEQYFAVNDKVIECLASMKGQCTCSAWEAAVEENDFCFYDVLGQSFMQMKAVLSSLQDDLSKPSEICATQLIQFLVIMMSKGVRPSGLDIFVGLIEAIGERVLEMPRNGREFLCEAFLMCLASANLSGIDLPFSKVTTAADEEAIWRLGMCGGDANLFLTSAFSLYIISSVVSVEPLTYLEGLEHLLDVALMVSSQNCLPGDEPLALVVLPTICDALMHLLKYKDDTTEPYPLANTRIAALDSVLRSLCGGEELPCDRIDMLPNHRLWATTRRLLREMDGEMGKETLYELVVCRLDGISRLLYVAVM